MANEKPGYVLVLSGRPAFSHIQLKRRGWKRDQITALLGNPDVWMDSVEGRYLANPLRLYAAKRVRAVERRVVWQRASA